MTGNDTLKRLVRDTADLAAKMERELELIGVRLQFVMPDAIRHPESPRGNRGQTPICHAGPDPASRKSEGHGLRIGSAMTGNDTLQFVMPGSIRHPGNAGAWIADQVRNDRQK